MVKERRIDIIAPKPRVAICREHLKNALIEFENRNVESAAAEVEDRHLRAVAKLVEAVGEGGGGRLVDDSLDRESSEFARDFRRSALGLVKIGGDRDDGAIDRLAECAFGVPFEFAQNEFRDLLRRPIAVAHA